MENMDWLEEELGGYEDDYLIFDCPGACVLLGFRVPTDPLACRPDRTIHTSSLPANASPKPKSVRDAGVRDLPNRIAVHGRQIQVLQVSIAAGYIHGSF